MAKKLKLLLIPLLVLGLFSVKTAAAHAVLWPFKGLWESVKCVADINCTVRAAGVAAQNFIIHETVGEDFEQITAADIEQMKRGEWDKGLAAAMGKIGSAAYAAPPPIRLADYVKAELSDNLLTSPAQATTVGLTALEPVTDIWKAMRNVAYGLFLVVMIAIGIMIILQHSISPRVVVTFTNSLPRILLGLVLITFSLPLIAFVVDLVAVFGVNVILGFLGSFLTGMATTHAAGGAASLVSGFTTTLIGTILDATSNVLGGSLPAMTVGIILFLAGLVLFGLSIIRLFTTYAWIVVMTIFSPLLLLLGSLPGQEGASTNLLRKLVAKTLVFPVILLLYVLALYFAVSGIVPATLSALSGGAIPQLLGDVVFFRFIGPLVALVLLAACFKAPSIIEEGLGINKPRMKK